MFQVSNFTPAVSISVPFLTALIVLSSKTALAATPIGDCNHLLNFLNKELSGHIELTNDIDCSTTPWYTRQDGSNPFTGEFDGKGYTISNVFFPPEAYSQTTKPIGFFNYINGATIKNLGLFNVTISIPAGEQSYQSEYAGGLVGVALNSKISHVTVLGNVTMNRPADDRRALGGIVGRANHTTIEYADFSGSVSNAPNVGAIAGSVSNSTLQNVYARNSIVHSSFPVYFAQNSFAGGLVGSLGTWEGGATLDKCFYDGVVTGDSQTLGGGCR